MLKMIYFSNKSETLPVESEFNFTAVGLSPDGRLAIAVNEGKQGIHFIKKNIKKSDYTKNIYIYIGYIRFSYEHEGVK